ncbi:MAG: hypothetical protein HFG70_03900 [Hungatella sp.]|nr:hypothetical protein [Hungatella sp.]
MKEYSMEDQKQYVEGLRRFESKGIPVYIDGHEPEEKDWDKIFQVQEDGAFYMCDYVGTDEGTLKEIRFDRVYNR